MVGHEALAIGGNRERIGFRVICQYIYILKATTNQCNQKPIPSGTRYASRVQQYKLYVLLLSRIDQHKQNRIVRILKHFRNADSRKKKKKKMFKYSTHRREKIRIF